MSEGVCPQIFGRFIKCEDIDEASPAPAVQYCLVLREWDPPDPSTEFRCFVKEGQLIGNSVLYFYYLNF